MAKSTGHYIKAGQHLIEHAPIPASEIDVALGGRHIRGIVDQVYIPPGCDEHCIGTLFIREI